MIYALQGSLSCNQMDICCPRKANPELRTRHPGYSFFAHGVAMLIDFNTILPFVQTALLDGKPRRCMEGATEDLWTSVIQ